MSQYVAKVAKEITLSTKFYELSLRGKNDEVVEIDIQGLMRADVGSEDAWINVTPIMKAYGKKFADWTRNKNVQEYINAVNRRFTKLADLNQLKIPFPESQFYKASQFDWLEQDCPLICTRRGKYHSGTWLHKELFIKFITVLDVELEIELHQMIMKIIKQSDLVKFERTGTKTLFHKLTDAIKEIYIPAQTSENAKKFAYSTLMTLANTKVLGTTAKAYCAKNNIEVTKDMMSARDALDEDKLKKIKDVEEEIWGLIRFAKITDYSKLKKEILGVEV